ncbi:MAG: hypothetical protein OXJ52_07370 [Oligoflexia bacterium]|nr:hypothetical protein [Oligoflexia bacterium]
MKFSGFSWIPAVAGVQLSGRKLNSQTGKPKQDQYYLILRKIPINKDLLALTFIRLHPKVLN